METRKDQKLKTRSKMETKEKNFEQEIESYKEFMKSHKTLTTN